MSRRPQQRQQPRHYTPGSRLANTVNDPTFIAAARGVIARHPAFFNAHAVVLPGDTAGTVFMRVLSKIADPGRRAEMALALGLDPVNTTHGEVLATIARAEPAFGDVSTMMDDMRELRRAESEDPIWATQNSSRGQRLQADPEWQAAFNPAEAPKKGLPDFVNDERDRTRTLKAGIAAQRFQAQEKTGKPRNGTVAVDSEARAALAESMIELGMLSPEDLDERHMDGFKERPKGAIVNAIRARMSREIDDFNTERNVERDAEDRAARRAAEREHAQDYGSEHEPAAPEPVEYQTPEAPPDTSLREDLEATASEIGFRPE